MSWKTENEIEYINGLGSHSQSLDSKREGVVISLSVESEIKMLEKYLRIAEDRTANGNWQDVDGPAVEAYVRRKISQLREF